MIPAGKLKLRATRDELELYARTYSPDREDEPKKRRGHKEPPATIEEALLRLAREVRHG